MGAARPLPRLNASGLLNLKGQLFGSLTVLHRQGSPKPRPVLWRCVCVCGKFLTVRHQNLLHKNCPKTHCGCLNVKPPPTLKTIYNDIYHIWKMMLDRCDNSRSRNYAAYGGRGIRVCERWYVFEVFLSDIGPRPSKAHSIDRVDPNDGYRLFKDDGTTRQVQWATQKTQSRNKRKSLFLPHPKTGEKVPAAEVAEYLGITYQQLRYKYQREGTWPTG